MRRTTVGLLVAAALLPGLRADACASVGPEGVRIAVASEEAIIVWDAATRTQHFVRRAQLATEAADVGFLVPTPTLPALAEASADGFDRLAALVKASTVHRYHLDVMPFTCAPLLLSARTAPPDSRAAGIGQPPPVRVLAFARVAGYEASVLEADDPDALAAWLAERGYVAPPTLAAWLQPYVERGWKISAFKYARDQASGSVPSGTVRISFQTDAPFYPYREPAGQSDGRDRVTRIYFVGTGRVGTALDAGSPARDSRAARVEYAAPTSGLAGQLAGVVPDGAVSDEAWMTVLLDTSWGRPSDSELHFPASDGPAYYPSETHVVWVPAELWLIALSLGVVYAVRVWRRKTSVPPMGGPAA